ncbi:NLI interacting factor-like phosphatase family protein [Tritrichomonas foetus]|uniref:Mitochondrial import inner membrane translocase subunit TIM50 n=1 Tax=Tritrichomonas foetus TaxID=1144522 RepID=A0A1J4JA10_9EUKA|nr:NLI interacting factor-like phosphatase family protein [Tritrichomonas foetus]|eukprot:OHS96022.1 NLI interacting factor-like phosphatase family protein [Tritrichomonas foetus]
MAQRSLTQMTLPKVQMAHVGTYEGYTPRFSPNKFSKLQKLIHKKKLHFYKPPPLPKNGQKTLVLDMDETLVHASLFPPHPSVNYFTLDDGTIVYTRPGLDEFINFAVNHFEVFIYTYAERCYAEPVLDIIAPMIDEDHRLYRDSCIVKKDIVIKDLTMLNRNLNKLIFVDDNDMYLKTNKENTIVIPMWKGIPNDKALTEWLIPILQTCINSSDVRDVIKSVENRVRRYTL